MKRYKTASRLMAAILHKDKSLNQYPWVINNLGFTGSIGLSILRDALFTWRPSILASITSVSQRKNYPTDLMAWTRQLGLHQTRVIRLPAVPERTSADWQADSRPTQWGLPEPKKLREIVLLSFLAHWPHPLKEMEPYVISLDTIRVNILDRNVGPSQHSRAQYLFRMNASIVSLERDRLSSNDPEGNPSLSLGVGIIRGIDVERNEIYVVTNLSDQSVLDTISCITVGMIRLPDSVFLDQSSKLGLPYVGGTLFQTPLSQPWIKGGRPRN